MSPMLLALALLVQQPETPQPAPKENLTSIEKRIREREARRAPLEHQIREAVDKNETETEVAQRLNQEFKENEAEIDATAAPSPACGRSGSMTTTIARRSPSAETSTSSGPTSTSFTPTPARINRCSSP